MMRNVLLGLVAAGSALAVAAPAAAQYYPAPAYGYGHNYGWGQVRALQVRIDAVERQIRVLDRRDRIRDSRADRLRDEARDIERRLHRDARNGLNPREAYKINIRIARLEQRVQYAVANNYGRYNRGWSDRDRDGRNDRYEDDHGWRHDR
jgi:hypothetical protein